MTRRLTLATLLAFVAWLSAGGEPRLSRAADGRSPAAAAAAATLDAFALPPAPRGYETLSFLRRHALRGENQRRSPWPSRTRGEGAGSSALGATRLVTGRAAGDAAERARRLTSAHAATEIVFPYDATAPPSRA